jgi:hypothetical protein
MTVMNGYESLGQLALVLARDLYKDNYMYVEHRDNLPRMGNLMISRSRY